MPGQDPREGVGFKRAIYHTVAQEVNNYATWLEVTGVAACSGHEATETGLAYAPVSQAHGHNHIVQCFSCCTVAQTSSVPHQVVADCALALVLWTLRSARTHHPPRALGSL